MASNETERDTKGRFIRGNQAAIKYGGHSFIATGKIPVVRGTRKLRKELIKIQRELEDNIPDLNAKKLLLVNQIIKSHGFTCLFEMYCRKAGLLDPVQTKRGQVAFQKGFKVYISLLNVQKSAIMALGLDERQAEEALTPYEIIKREEEKAGKIEGMTKE